MPHLTVEYSDNLEADLNVPALLRDMHQALDGKSEAALLLENRVGTHFDGVITGSSNHGVWVRIFSPPTEGKLGDLRRNVEVGDRVRVKLVSTNVERGFIDFVLTD